MVPTRSKTLATARLPTLKIVLRPHKETESSGEPALNSGKSWKCVPREIIGVYLAYPVGCRLKEGFSCSIFSTKNTDVCWSLPDGEIDSPVGRHALLSSKNAHTEVHLCRFSLVIRRTHLRISGTSPESKVIMLRETLPHMHCRHNRLLRLCIRH
jgi:hypothetical protein